MDIYWFISFKKIQSHLSTVIIIPLFDIYFETPVPPPKYFAPLPPRAAQILKCKHFFPSPSVLVETLEKNSKDFPRWGTMWGDQMLYGICSQKHFLMHSKGEVFFSHTQQMVEYQDFIDIEYSSSLNSFEIQNFKVPPSIENILIASLPPLTVENSLKCLWRSFATNSWQVTECLPLGS